MPKLVAKEGFLIPEGQLVDVRVENVELMELEFDGEKTERLSWKFTVVEDGPWKGETVSGMTSTTFTAHPNCKAYNWVTAITGRKYKDGEQLDTDALIGMPCRVIIRHKKKNDNIYMNVSDVLNAKGSSRSPEEAPF